MPKQNSNRSATYTLLNSGGRKDSTMKMRNYFRNLGGAGDSTATTALKLAGMVAAGLGLTIVTSQILAVAIKDPTKGWLQDLILAVVGFGAAGIALWRKHPDLGIGLAAGPVTLAAERTYHRMGWADKVTAMITPASAVAPAGYPLSDNAYTSWNGAGLPISSSAYINGVGGQTSGLYQQVAAR